MHTKEYVKKYRLDDHQYSNHFNTDLFLSDLNEEMMERINMEKESRKKIGLEYSYRIFQVIIQEMQQKFCAISNKKVGGPLRQGLWNAFYAKYIIPTRANDFPEEHKKILLKKELSEKAQIEKELKKTLIQEPGEDIPQYLRRLRAEVNAEYLRRNKKF